MPPAPLGPAGSTIPKLFEDLGHDSAVVDRFVSDYLGLLDHRLDAVRQLLAGAGEQPVGDAGESIRVAVLSLETTSAMLGGTEVVAAAQGLREAVVEQQSGRDREREHEQNRVGLHARFDRLRVAAEDFRSALVSQGYPTPPAQGWTAEPPTDSRPRGRSR